MASLAEIRARLQAQASRGNNQGSGNQDNSVFAHWNLANNSSCTIRFLKDGDNSNTFFWAERLMIRLPFSGIKGQTDSKEVTVNVPCMEMYGETCPILSEVRPWFKDKSLEDMGKKYWKKKSYIFQGLVVDPGSVKEENAPENPIRRFMINSQIYNIIKGALMDPEIENLPTDEFQGLDFRINKTAKGEYADYSTSAWARRERALSTAELEAIQKHGLYNLKDFLPKKPGEVELKIISEMFAASVDGQAYDTERWGQYFRPAGVKTDDDAGASNGAKSNSSTKEEMVPTPSLPKPTPTIVSKPAATEPSASSGNSDPKNRALEILAQIKARKGT